MGTACQIDNIGAQTHPALPAGQFIRLGMTRVRVEILRVGQRVQQATEGTERHHRRPMSVKTAALWSHIHVILRVGRQPRQQQAVGTHVGDDGCRVGHKAHGTVCHIIVHRPNRVVPTHQCRCVGHPVHGHRCQRLAGHNVAHLYVVDV